MNKCPKYVRGECQEEITFLKALYARIVLCMKPKLTRNWPSNKPIPEGWVVATVKNSPTIIIVKERKK